MYHRMTTEIYLVPYKNISHIQTNFCCIKKGIRSSTVKMSSPQQNVLIYPKNQELVWQITLKTVN